MTAVNCPSCGAPVTFGTHEGVRVPLDTHEVMKGEYRFGRRQDGRLFTVAPNANVQAFTDHRETCPTRRR